MPPTLFSLSRLILISSLAVSPSPSIELSVSDRKRILSSASDALLISSLLGSEQALCQHHQHSLLWVPGHSPDLYTLHLRKMSLLEYSELMMISINLATSAWKVKACAPSRA
jgi:hypothetical protein